MPPVKHTNKQPVSTPPVLQTTAQDSQIKNKIKRIGSDRKGHWEILK